MASTKTVKSDSKEPKFETGKEILSYCTSCKMDLNHFIVAMKGDQVVKVECKTCKKTHNYRAPKGITEPQALEKAAAKKAAKVAAAAEAHAKDNEGEWERLMETLKTKPSKNYSLKTPFTPGDKIAHSTFGEGIVQRVIYPNKIEVIFRQDLKTLIHAQGK
jgi:hypothetical protein